MSASAPPPPPHHPLDGSAAFEPRTNTKKNHLGGSRTDKRSEIARALTNHIRHTERPATPDWIMALGDSWAKGTGNGLVRVAPSIPVVNAGISYTSACEWVSDAGKEELRM